MSRQDDERLLKRITDRWGIPLAEGVRVYYDGRPGIVQKIVAMDRVKVKFTREQDKALSKYEYHPIVHLDYEDGVDYRASFPEDVAEWRKSQGLA